MQCSFILVHDNLERLLNAIATCRRSRRTNGLDAHHLQLWLVVLHTFRVPDVEDVHLLGLPDTLVRNVLTLHLHLLSIGIHVVCQLLVCTVDERFDLFLAGIVDELHDRLIVSTIWIHHVHKILEGDVDRVCIRCDHIVHVLGLKELIEILVHLLLNPTDRELTGHGDCLGMVDVEPTEVLVTKSTIS